MKRQQKIGINVPKLLDMELLRLRVLNIAKGVAMLASHKFNDGRSSLEFSCDSVDEAVEVASRIRPALVGMTAMYQVLASSSQCQGDMPKIKITVIDQATRRSIKELKASQWGKCFVRAEIVEEENGGIQ